MGGFQDAAGVGELGEWLGVGGVHYPQAAIGDGRDPVPLVLVGAEALPGLGRFSLLMKLAAV